MGEEGGADFPWPSHQPWGLVTNGSSYDCDYEHHLDHHLFMTVMITAAVLVVVLNIIGVLRKYRQQNPKNWVWDIPGLSIPFKLLGSTPYRFIYCIIMSCWGADMLQSVADKGLYYRSSHGLLDAFDFFILTPGVLVLRQTLAYYPVFCCVDAPIPSLGHLIGFLYILLLGASNVFTEYVMIRGCSYRGQLLNRDIGISLGVNVPIYILYLVIAGFFLCSLLREIVLLFLGKRNTQKCQCPDEYTGYREHVKNLVARPIVISSRPINPDGLWSWLLRGVRFMVPYSSSFKFPLPYLSAVFMTSTIIYQLVVSLTAHGVILADNLVDDVKRFRVLVKDIDWLVPKVDKIYEDALSLVQSFQIIFPLGTFISTQLLAYFVVYMMLSFHKRVREVFRGDFSHLVASEPLPSRAYRLTSLMRFTAFQVAYIVFTWFLHTLMLWSLASVGALFYVGFNRIPKLATHIWAWLIAPFLWGAGVHFLQLFLCKYVFLDRKGSGRFVVIRHSNIYQILAYIMFFFNFIFGFGMCLLRVFALTMFTIVMLFRVDIDVYMRGLEGWDTGHRTFVGYIYMEYVYNNPVLRMFVKLLLDSVGEEAKVRKNPSRASISKWSIQTSSSLEEEEDTEDEEEESHSLLAPRLMSNGGPRRYHDTGNLRNQAAARWPVKSRRARNRWLVAYTLLRNPSLQGLTGSRLAEATQLLQDNSQSNHYTAGNQGTNYGTMNLRHRK